MCLCILCGVCVCPLRRLTCCNLQGLVRRGAAQASWVCILKQLAGTLAKFVDLPAAEVNRCQLAAVKSLLALCWF